MKAITLYQPHALLWALQHKRFETRSWQTRYRGPIAIHAANKTLEKVMELYFKNPMAEMQIVGALRDTIGYDYEELMRYGCVIAVAELVGCYLIDRIQEFNGAPYETGYWKHELQFCDVSEQEKLFGDWTSGRYAWEIANVKLLPDPIPARGFQGLWDWRTK